MADIRLSTQDEVPGPDEDVSDVLFMNHPEYGNARLLRTNVLSAQSDLKMSIGLGFRLEVKRHAAAIAPGEDVVVVFMEARPGAAADVGLQRPASGDGGLPGQAGNRV